MTKTKTVRRDYRKLKFFGLLAFVAAFSFVFLAQRNGKLEDDTSAANLANFNAGYIISDFQMTDYDSMSEGEIQNFLTSKNSCNNRDYGYYQRLSAGSAYRWHFENGHFICLSEERFGNNDDEIGFQYGETAAHIIWQAAQDYRINPKVLLVLLQKETGLITDPIPNNGDYRKATGYGCPDTAACSSKYYGFKNQVRNAAYLFRIVMDGNSSYYPIGNNYIQYNPNGACGGSVVNVQNLATSALYRYTPYQPNAGALAAGYGTAPCGAYGNRNFYSYFEDWFGGIKEEKEDVINIPEPQAKIEEILDSEVYTIASVSNPNFVLDIYGGVKNLSNGSNIQLYGKHGNENQEFKLVYDVEKGYYQVVNPSSDKALNVYACKTRSETNVQLWEKDSSCASYWKIVKNDDGTYSFLSACSGLALDVYGGKAANEKNIQIYENNWNNNQKWTLQVKRQKLSSISSDKKYVIVSAADSEYALDIYGGDALAKNGSNIQLYNKHGDKNQQFQFIYNDNRKAYEIVYPEKNKSLNAYGGMATLETNVQLWERDAGCASYWNITKNADAYTIESACSKLVLDVYGGKIESEKNIQIYRNNAGGNQKWLFEEV